MLRQSTQLGQSLIEAGALNEEQLREALAEHQRSGRKLGEILVRQNIVSATTLVQTLAKKLGVKGCHLRHGLVDPLVAKLIDREECKRLKALPLFKVRNRLIVAMAEPQNLPAIDRLTQLSGCEVRPVLALEHDVEEFSQKYLTEDVSVDEFLVSLKESDVEVVERESVDDRPVTDLDQMVEGSPIVNLVNLVILSAIRDGASDIHIEPDRKRTRIRYRIDGVLRELMSPPATMHAAIVSRVKVIGKMDIAEKRLPQEGRVHIVAEGREIDLRVSSMPTILGEKVVLRILDKSNLHIELERLGFRPDSLAAFRRMLLKPHGLVLVTGPTGSGKTTTLYSMLNHINAESINIMTLEDPVEYPLPLIRQTQIGEAAKIDFASGIRSLMRQDPDVILVGEIRDRDTAEMAFRAAMTGHQVFSTLHTNSALRSIPRLIDLGIRPDVMSGNIIGIIAQRLVRRLCPHCRRAEPPSDEEAAMYRNAGLPAPAALFRPVGCPRCTGGYRGRLALMEIVRFDRRLDELVVQGASLSALDAAAKESGFVPIGVDALRRAADGATTLAEAGRVIDLTIYR